MRGSRGASQICANRPEERVAWGRGESLAGPLALPPVGSDTKPG